MIKNNITGGTSKYLLNCDTDVCTAFMDDLIHRHRNISVYGLVWSSHCSGLIYRPLERGLGFRLKDEKLEIKRLKKRLKDEKLEINV